MTLLPVRGPAPSADPLVAHLAAQGARPALVGARVPGGALAYAELAERVADAAATITAAAAGRRRLLLLEPAAEVDVLVAHLGAQAAGQPVLLAAPGATAGLAEAWSPDVVLDAAATADLPSALAVLADVPPRHDLHPDLALLLSTSGSTGSPKLVRLGREGLVANARAIAESLGIRPDDVAPTTLPLHYCYGLSVVHSHLAVGASLLLTDASVTDDRFWDEAAAHGATTLAGVPHTFDLLERTGRADRLGEVAPRLRYVTQAGGRMDPATVRRWAERGQAQGFDLVVMYGQTEATARIAVLPPDLALTAPGAIGRPVPGSRLEVEPVEGLDLDEAGADLGEGVGELVLHGPGVMLGYAQDPADLARGRDVQALRTGDLGRVRPDGLLEVVGRLSRFAKVLGLRVDLDRVERLLAAEGVVALAADGGARLVLGVVEQARPVDAAAVTALAARLVGLPPARVAVVALPEVPRLPTGKVDHRAVVRLAAPPDPATAPCDAALRHTAAPVTAGAVAALLADLLGRPAGTGDSFVGLGGDSLSYVEASLRLEGLLGRLPAGWHALSAAELAAAARPVAPGRGPRWLRTRRVETGVLVRAFAIVSIVGTHANLFVLLGGAHLLLAVVGFNLGRFQLAGTTDARERARGVLRAAVRIAVPAVLVIATVSLWTEGLGWQQALLVNGLTERSWSEPAWYYWFIEAVVTLLVLTAALLVVPGVARLERRHPFALPVLLTLAALVTRYGVLEAPGDQIHRAHVVVWLFTLGWAASRAARVRHRLLLSAVALGTVPGFFDEGARDAYVAVGLLALVWLPSVPLPDVAARLAGVLAAASLWTYLVHWQVYPHLEHELPWAATLLSLLAGVVAWRAAEAVGRHLATIRVTGNTARWRTVRR